jgi:hypothetical protein
MSQTPSPPFGGFGSGITSLQYTIWDVNSNVVNNVTQVNEYFSDLVVVTGTPPDAGTWYAANASPLNNGSQYGSVVNGQFVDNLAGNYTATQSFSAMVGGVNYVVSTQASMVVLGGYSTSALTHAYNPNSPSP